MLMVHFLQYDAVENAVKLALKRFGKIDILVNCELIIKTSGIMLHLLDVFDPTNQLLQGTSSLQPVHSPRMDSRPVSQT